mgnify:CR=1 FL=1
MYVDAQLLFSDAQAVTATAVSTNVVDLRAVRDMGLGEPLYIVCIVDVAFTDGGSDTTIAVSLETDSDEAFGSATVQGTMTTFAALTAAGATQMIFPIPPSWMNERYARLRYTTANGNLTTGSFTAFIAIGVQKATKYPDDITVS